MTNPSIIYQDPSFLVINKPSGLIVHTSSPSELRRTGPKNLNKPESSVVSWLLKHYPQVATVGDKSSLQPTTYNLQPNIRPGIVHRLDKETSGIMIVALTQNAFKYFKKQFQDRTIKKTYVALVYGNVNNDSGTIDAPLGKLGTRQTTQIHGKKELVAREAITDYKVIKRYSSLSTPPTGEHSTLLEVIPKTGRTHQIRVHLKHIGNPIVCDPWYAGRRAICPSELGRLFLHAKKLEFTSPNGQAIAIEADLPNELQGFIENLSLQEK